MGSGRSLSLSSARRTSGITPVAREGRVSFTSRSHSSSCRSRSSRLAKRRTLKNEPFTQPTRFSTAPLLLRPMRPAELEGEAQVQRRLPERRVPLDAGALPPDHHRLGIVEHGHERNAAEHLEGFDQCPHERLHPSRPARSSRARIARVLEA